MRTNDPSPSPALPTLRTRRSTVIATLASLTMLAGACTADDPNQAGGSTAGGSNNGVIDISTGDIDLVAGLETYQNCDALLDRLKAEGLDRVGPYGFGHGWYGPSFAAGNEEAMERTEAETTASDSGSSTAPAFGESDDASFSSEGGSDFSGTNNQEVGVDEADLVKTDGTRLVVALGSKLRVVDLATNSLEREIDLGEDYWGGELFLNGDTAILMSQGWSPVALAGDRLSRPDGVSITRILQVDLDSGTVDRTLEFEGNYLSARDIDGTLRIVLWAGVGNLEFLYPSGPSSEERATENNRAVIEDSTIEQWLPTYRLLDGSTEIESGSLIECDRMFVPAAFSGFGSLTVLTIDANAGLDPLDTAGVLSDGQTVYASTDRLAVATSRWPEWNERGEPIAEQNYNTLIHSFDITEPTRADYIASGSVEGHLLNQYSLSEFGGNLRVATTAGDPWFGEQSTSESFITVMAENGQDLETIGKVGGIGEGERIYAVRFMGTMAYVVTFRQIDPLYAIDLSDPTAPTVLGELKIPGFSAYLHPVGDGLLMGVGQDADEQSGFTTGSQVSLFDVSDPTDPQRIDQVDLGDQAYSQVEWDARAFTWWGPTNTGFVPISWYRYDERTQSDENGSASVAVTVSDRTLVETGRIVHDPRRECERGVTPIPLDDDIAVMPETESLETESEAIAPAPGEDEYCWTWTPEIRRTVIADGKVYTISDAGVKVSDLNSFEALGWVPFSM